MSSQVFKMAKAALIVCFGISHLVKTSATENSTNRANEMAESNEAFCLKASIILSNKSRPGTLEPGVCFPQRRQTRPSLRYLQNKLFHLDKNVGWHWQIRFFLSEICEGERETALCLTDGLTGLFWTLINNRFKSKKGVYSTIPDKLWVQISKVLVLFHPQKPFFCAHCDIF